MSTPHLKPDCKGKWIDISTLTDPRREKCSGCGISRMKPLTTEEVDEILDAPTAPADPPADTTSFATASTEARWRPVRNSLAPSRAKARATAPPTAPPAP